MADAAASALVKLIFEKLADEAFKRYARAQGIHSELENLGRELSLIQALLHDASEKEVTDRSVGIWLNSLQHLAYDIEDVLDDVATEAMRRELTQESGASTSKVKKLIVPTCCTNFSLSHRLSPKIDSITIELQRLYKAKAELGLTVKDGKERDPNRGNETSLLESDVVGREGEKKRQLKKLLGGDGSSKEKFSIVPIVGMGGVGKTTLARLLYNDTKVQGHFQLKGWVCVSDNFDILKISNSIFQSMTRENKKYDDLDQVQNALREQLKGKRFLVVLDDVWTESYDLWENLVRPLNSGAPGSRVIMTTRKDKLLKTIGFNHLDLLKSLSSEDALSLFALHALGVDTFDPYPNLREKAEAIVKKCGTLPLALKAIGRLLRTKTTPEKWDDVLSSQIWDSKYVGDLPEDWKVIFPALMLSYHDLSANLKRLFAYCSLFPKDFLFNKEELVLLWMGEGFLSQSNATKSQEDFGKEDFEALLSRSFFQHAPNDESLYVMHDLMNDLATFVAGDFVLRFENHNEPGKEALTKYRHMSFVGEEYETYHKFEPFKRARSLRTLLGVSMDQNEIRFFSSKISKILVDLLPQLPLLRVLSLSGFIISEVPDFIGSLKHLRYLNLSGTDIKELPENIGNLFNLQTLIIFGCRSLTKLPKSFSKLKKLQHFDFRGTPSLTQFPLGIGELKSLQTLTKIVIGGDGGFAITELKGLNNLGGELSIEGLCKAQWMHMRQNYL
ncbi:putative virus X resistance protein-like, coiled-coil [Helianthus annuus]|nr:putative virus X resistance protein-like, coiled-coil [Helianthus annuus]